MPEVPNWDVGLVFSWPLFDAAVLARADASIARESARQLELDSIRQVIRAQVEEAYVAYGAAQATIPALEEALVAARANFTQAQTRFKAGLGTAVEIAQAEALLAGAEVNEVVGRYRLATARARLGRVIDENL